MPRFFFDTKDQNGQVTLDEEGADFDSADQALAEAKRALASIAAELPAVVGSCFYIHVRDSLGKPLGSIGLKYTLGNDAEPAETFLGC